MPGEDPVEDDPVEDEESEDEAEEGDACWVGRLSVSGQGADVGRAMSAYQTSRLAPK